MPKVLASRRWQRSLSRGSGIVQTRIPMAFLSTYNTTGDSPKKRQYFIQYQGHRPPHLELELDRVEPGDLYIENSPNHIQVYMVDLASPSSHPERAPGTKTWTPWLIDKHGYKAQTLKHPVHNDRYVWFQGSGVAGASLGYKTADRLSRFYRINLGGLHDVVRRLRTIFPAPYNPSADKSEIGPPPSSVPKSSIEVIDLTNEDIPGDRKRHFGEIDLTNRGRSSVGPLEPPPPAPSVPSSSSWAECSIKTERPVEYQGMHQDLLNVRMKNQSLLKELEEENRVSQKRKYLPVEFMAQPNRFVGQ